MQGVNVSVRVERCGGCTAVSIALAIVASGKIGSFFANRALSLSSRSEQMTTIPIPPRHAGFVVTVLAVAVLLAKGT